MFPDLPSLIIAGEGESFGIDLGRKPELEFQTFNGPNDVRAAVSPDCSFELVKAAIETAASTLDVYIYNVSAPHLLKLLSDAKARGVAVRVMYDAKDTNGGEVAKLEALHVELKVAPSRDPRRVFDVCHQKFAVIDNSRVLFGSANWAASSIPARLPGTKRKKGNREWLIRIDNPEIAAWYQALFDADWNIEEFESFGIEFGIEEREALLVPAPPFDPPTDTPLRHFPALTGTILPLTSPDNYFHHLKKILSGAKERIYLQQQYIKGGVKAPAVDELLRIVREKKDAGLDVRIIVSSRFASGWIGTKDTLEAHGLLDNLAAINLDRFIHCHNKGVIADNHVVVSSTNWSENSISRAREAGAAFHSAELGLYFAEVFEDDWDTGWTIDQGDAGPSFDIVDGEEVERVAIHPADEE